MEPATACSTLGSGDRDAMKFLVICHKLPGCPVLWGVVAPATTLRALKKTWAPISIAIRKLHDQFSCITAGGKSDR
jgi:hypothetical protein